MIDANVINGLCDIALKAGHAILDIVEQGIEQLDIQRKQDGSKVTQADFAANRIVLEGLSKLNIDNYPIVSEESDIAETVDLHSMNYCWLIDPLDGTRGFVKGNTNYTVNIALIENGYPIIGIIAHPVNRICYWAAKDQGAYIYDTQGSIKLEREAYTPPPWRIITGLYQNQQFWAKQLSELGTVEFIGQNSSYKFCTLAQNKADLYPRGSQISAWDTAAGQCLLEEAGGAVIDFNGQRLCYTGRAKAPRNQPDTGFFAIANREHLDVIKNYLKHKGVIHHDKTR